MLKSLFLAMVVPEATSKSGNRATQIGADSADSSPLELTAVTANRPSPFSAGGTGIAKEIGPLVSGVGTLPTRVRPAARRYTWYLATFAPASQVQHKKALPPAQRRQGHGGGGGVRHVSRTGPTKVRCNNVLSWRLYSSNVVNA